MESDQTTAEAAFEELYQARFGSIYDFSIRLAQDRNIAALVVQSVFLRALRAFGAGQGDGLELQLYTAAHLDTAERLRGRRGESEQVDEPYAVIDVARLSTPGEDVAEMGRLVWSAAIELKVNDYELLDLGIRHKLDPKEIATVLRGRPESVERKLMDAQTQFEQAFTARLLFTRGRRECIDLDFELGDAEWNSSLPRRILRHANACDVCRGEIASHPSSVELLGALMPVPAPARWQQTILERLKEAVRDEPAAPAAGAGTQASASDAATPTLAADQPEATAASQRQLRPLPETGGSGKGGSFADWLDSIFGGGGPRGPLLAALLGGLLVIAIVIGSLCAAGTFDGDGDDEPEPTGTLTVTPTAEASGTPTVTTTPTTTPTLELLLQPTVPPVPTEAPLPTAPPLPTATTVPSPVPSPTVPAPTVPAPTEEPKASPEP